MLAIDVETNRRIGKHGADAILTKMGTEGKVAILTHCNTGSLATVTYRIVRLIAPLEKVSSHRRSHPVFLLGVWTIRQVTVLLAMELHWALLEACGNADNLLMLFVPKLGPTIRAPA